MSGDRTKVLDETAGSEIFFKEGCWFWDQSIFVVLTHSLDHIKENLPSGRCR